MTETKNQAPARGVKYETDAEGQIFRTAPGGTPELQALLRDGVLSYLSPAAKGRAPAIMKHLKQTGAAVAKAQDAFMVDSPAAPETAPQVEEEGGVVGATGVQITSRQIPPAPKLDKNAGDKTPAYVEWLREYHPEDFAKRFGVIGEGSITVRKPGIVRGKREVVETQRPALLARRATHLTTRPRD